MIAKRVFAILSGIIAAFIVISIVQEISRSIYPPPTNIDLKDKEAMKKLIEAMPLAAMILVLFSYIIGSFAGGLICALINKEGKIIQAIIVGLFLTIAGIANVSMLPHPLWFSVTSILVYIPFSCLGWITIAKR